MVEHRRRYLGLFNSVEVTAGRIDTRASTSVSIHRRIDTMADDGRPFRLGCVSQPASPTHSRGRSTLIRVVEFTSEPCPANGFECRSLTLPSLYPISTQGSPPRARVNVRRRRVLRDARRRRPGAEEHRLRQGRHASALARQFLLLGRAPGVILRDHSSARRRPPARRRRRFPRVRRVGPILQKRPPAPDLARPLRRRRPRPRAALRHQGAPRGCPARPQSPRRHLERGQRAAPRGPHFVAPVRPRSAKGRQQDAVQA